MGIKAALIFLAYSVHLATFILAQLRIRSGRDAPPPVGETPDGQACDRPPPAGFARWTGGLIAAELGDVHEQQVWRFLRERDRPGWPQVVVRER